MLDTARARRWTSALAATVTSLAALSTVVLLWAYQRTGSDAAGVLRSGGEWVEWRRLFITTHRVLLVVVLVVDAAWAWSALASARRSATYRTAAVLAVTATFVVLGVALTWRMIAYDNVVLVPAPTRVDFDGLIEPARSDQVFGVMVGDDLVERGTYAGILGLHVAAVGAATVLVWASLLALRSGDRSPGDGTGAPDEPGAASA